MPDNSRFCTECGNPLGGDSAGSGGRPGTAPSGSPAPSGSGSGSAASASAASGSAGHAGPAPISGPIPTGSSDPGWSPGSSGASGGYSTPVAGDSRMAEPEVPLVPGEQQLWECRLTPHLLTPHLKTRLTLTDKRIIVRYPNTLFAFLPVGYAVQVVGYSAVESVGFGNRIRTQRVLTGVGFILFSIFGVMSSFGMLRQASQFGAGGGAGAFLLLLSLLGIALGGLFIWSARLTGVWIRAGGEEVGATGRGHEIAVAREAGLRVTSATTQTEISRNRGGLSG